MKLVPSSIFHILQFWSAYMNVWIHASGYGISAMQKGIVSNYLEMELQNIIFLLILCISLDRKLQSAAGATDSDALNQ